MDLHQRDDSVAELGGAISRRMVTRCLAGGGVAAAALAVLGVRSAAQEASPVASPTTTGSVKFVALFGAPADAAVFERYYAETHVPLARKLPGLQRLETARILGTAEGGTAPYYRIAELWFADMGQLQAAVASQEGQAVVADVANFATGGVTILVAQVDMAEAAPAA